MNDDLSKKTEKNPYSPPVAADAAAGEETIGFWGRHRWLPYVMPLAVYMLLGYLEPKPAADTPPTASAASEDSSAADGEAPDTEKSPENETETDDAGFALSSYPLAYTVRLGATIGCVLLFLPVYRQFPWRVSPLALGVGVVGAVVWIGLCRAGLEEKLLEPLGLANLLGLGERAAYDPLSALKGQMGLLVGFLAVRFVGLALIVPLIEEFFLRGFVMRFVLEKDWWKVPFGTATTLSLVVGTAYGMLAHPAELFAAAAWFSLISWLMVRTKNIWDCVAAHAITNLLLGVYVLWSGHWELW